MGAQHPTGSARNESPHATQAPVPGAASGSMSRCMHLGLPNKSPGRSPLSLRRASPTAMPPGVCKPRSGSVAVVLPRRFGRWLGNCICSTATAEVCSRGWRHWWRRGDGVDPDFQPARPGSLTASTRPCSLPRARGPGCCARGRRGRLPGWRARRGPADRAAPSSSDWLPRPAAPRAFCGRATPARRRLLRRSADSFLRSMPAGNSAPIWLLRSETRSPGRPGVRRICRRRQRPLRSPEWNAGRPSGLPVWPATPDSPGMMRPSQAGKMPASRPCGCLGAGDACPAPVERPGVRLRRL